MNPTTVRIFYDRPTFRICRVVVPSTDADLEPHQPEESEGFVDAPYDSVDHRFTCLPPPETLNLIFLRAMAAAL